MSSTDHHHLFFFLLLLLPHRRRHHLLLLLFVLLPHLVTSITFDYTRFHRDNFTNDRGSCPEGTHKICLQGNGTYADSDHSIQFTNDVSTSGWAIYSEALPLWKWVEDNTTAGARKVTTNFTTRFHLNLSKDSPMTCTKTIADGLAFSLSPYPHRIQPLSDGGMLGLVSRTNMLNASAEGGFVAVEIDTYSNSQWDPPYVHVGIDVNSIRSVVNRSLTGLTNLSSNKLDVVGEVRFGYDSVAGNLTATVQRGNTVYAQLSYRVDLSTILPQLVAVSLSATAGYCAEYHRVTSWSLDSTWDPVVPPSTSGSKRKTVIVAVTTSSVVGLLVISGVVLWVVARRKRARKARKKMEEELKQQQQQHVQEGEEGGDTFSQAFAETGGPRRLEYEELAAATGNFDDERKLGAGGSGAVYRGFLSGLNREVAIKRVTSSGGGGDPQRGRKEYVAEVKIISRLRHRNLVQLAGWCHQRDGEFLLAYELMPNLSLDRHLFSDVENRAPLGWPVRYNIALGVASALLYLHEEADRCVVHRDVKSSNVMLDENFNTKLGDFGLARLTEHGRELQTTMLGGTLGYMAPECFYTGRASTESDVHAFGVVALEIATGRRAIEEHRERNGNQMVRLVQWVWDLFAKGAILEAADQRLDMDSVDQKSQMERLLVVGLWCAHPDAQCRPAIRKAMAALNFEDVKIDLPKEMPVAVYAAPERCRELLSPGRDITTSTSSLVDYTVSSLYSVGR